MGPRKRVSRIGSRIVAADKENLTSVATQTDIVGQMPGGKAKRMKMTQTSKQHSPLPIPDNKSNGINKMCQTEEPGSTDRMGGRVIKARGGFIDQIDHLKTLMVERRAEAIGLDRQRLAKMVKAINSDPPPCWQAASKIWLEIDKLEKRIKRYDANEALKNGNNKNETPGSSGSSAIKENSSLGSSGSEPTA